MREFYTSKMVAMTCRVTLSAVDFWIDSGAIPPLRMVGSEKRFLSREDIIAFLKGQGMPYGEFEKMSVLLIGSGNEVIRNMEGAFAEAGGFRIDTAVCRADAFMIAAETAPECVVVDYDLGSSEANAIASAFQKNPLLSNAILIGLHSSDDEIPGLLDRSLFVETFRKYLDSAIFDKMAERIRTLVNERQKQHV